MGLWIMFTDAMDSDIEDACRAASTTLQRRGVSPAVASNAALDAADLSEDYNEPTTPAADAVAAWFAAEDAALRRLNELNGEWPHMAALIYTENQDAH